MNLIVSGVVKKDDRLIAHLQFEDGGRFAEGVIPDCKIIKQKGFLEEEILQLEDYMRANLSDLKKEAAKINPFTAMMK